MLNFPLLTSGIVAATAALLVYGALGVVIGWLSEHAVANPTSRSSHTVPTPQGAGIVILPTALAMAAIAIFFSGSEPPGGVIHATLAAAAALGLVAIGFIDDTRGLGIVSRLVAQVLAVAVSVAFLPPEMRIFPSHLPLVVERIVEGCAVLWFINVVNFMDGIDWISAVETVAITLGIVLLAALGIVPAGYGLAAVALLGAMVGFAPWNAPRARLFLGDAGSLPIGFLLGLLLLHVAAANALAAAAILPLYYFADATITLFRRLLRGERVWQAHREHFYQQATNNGFTAREIVGRIALLDMVLIILAIGSALAGTLWAAIAGLLAAAAVARTLMSFAKSRR